MTKSKKIDVRVDTEFFNEFNSYLEVHTTTDKSKFIRDAISEKMYRDKPVVSQLDQVVRIIDEKFSELKIHLDQQLSNIDLRIPKGDKKVKKNLLSELGLNDSK